MTEAQWLTCTDPTLMLASLWDKVSDRKVRLFAVACIQRMSSCWFRPGAIETVQTFVDLQSTSEELARFVDPWDYRGHEDSGWYRLFQPDHFRTDAAAEIAQAIAARAGDRVMTYNAFSAARDAALKVQCCLLRDLVGPAPFRPVVLDPASLTWNGGTVPKMAQVIYDDRAFDRLPILAGALEEAGCTEADILDHCRQPGEHVRGCWVVDLLLGKA